MDFGSLFLARPCQTHDKGSAVLGTRFTCDEPTIDEPVEHAGQRRPFVREGAMQFEQRRRSRFMQVAEDVGLGLRQLGCMLLNVEPDSMRRAVNAED